MKNNRILARMNKTAEKYHVKLAIDEAGDKLQDAVSFIEEAINEANDYNDEIDCRNAEAVLKELLERIKKEIKIVNELSSSIDE